MAFAPRPPAFAMAIAQTNAACAKRSATNAAKSKAKAGIRRRDSAETIIYLKMNVKIIKMVVLAGATVVLFAAPARAGSTGDATPLERLAALVDYIGADYAGAVKAGQVIAQAEYDEQGSLITEVQRLAAQLGA